jgi:hypothetical protein
MIGPRFRRTSEHIQAIDGEFVRILKDAPAVDLPRRSN